MLFFALTCSNSSNRRGIPRKFIHGILKVSLSVFIINWFLTVLYLWIAMRHSFPMMIWDLELGKFILFSIRSLIPGIFPWAMCTFFLGNMHISWLSLQIVQQCPSNDSDLPFVYDLKFVLPTGGLRHISFSTFHFSALQSQSLIPPRAMLFIPLWDTGPSRKENESSAAGAPHSSWYITGDKSSQSPCSRKGKFSSGQEQLHGGFIMHIQHCHFLTHLAPTLPGREVGKGQCSFGDLSISHTTCTGVFGMSSRKRPTLQWKDKKK